MSLYNKVRQIETIQYVDVVNLYTYICKYYKFPIGHPVIHVGNACKDKEACLRMEGLMKCSIVQPERLFHSVLPFRRNKKLLFCLYRSYVLEQNISGQCTHTADVGRDVWNVGY